MSKAEVGGTPYAALKYTGGDGLDINRAKWDAFVSASVRGRRCDVPFSEQPKGRLAKSTRNFDRLERARATHQAARRR